MNITTVQNEFSRAQQLRSEGKLIEAAHAFLAAQRMASQCRSAKRHHLFAYAHLAACLMANMILGSKASLAEKSEAGRIKAESTFLFQKGA